MAGPRIRGDIEKKRPRQGFSGRRVLRMTATLSGLAMAVGAVATYAQDSVQARAQLATIDAKPEPIGIDLARTAVIVVDMQNDFGAEGGMFHLAGIDISKIQGQSRRRRKSLPQPGNEASRSST